MSHVNRITFLMEIARAAQRRTHNNRVSSPRTQLRHLYGWETRLHPVYEPGSTNSRKRIKSVTFAERMKEARGKIHRYRSDRVAPAIRESIFDARLASFRYWYHLTNDNPDTVHRAVPSFSAVSIYTRCVRIPPKSIILQTRDSGLEIARSECDSRVQSLLIATLADRHGTLDKTGGSLDRWGRPLSFSLFLYLSRAHVGQGCTRHKWNLFHKEPNVYRM